MNLQHTYSIPRFESRCGLKCQRSLQRKSAVWTERGDLRQVYIDAVFRYAQQVGRGLRLPPGCSNLVEAQKNKIALDKEDCIVLDVTDNSGRHSLVTLNTLFGLPANMDLKGKTVVQAKKAVDAALSRAPSVDLDKVTSLQDLQVAAERIDLFEVKWPQEVLDNSPLKWHKYSDDHYEIRLPKGEDVIVQRNLLGKWEVLGTINGNSFHERNKESLPEAFKLAQQMLDTFGKYFLKLLRRDQKWHKDLATEPQWNVLRKFYRAQANTFPKDLSKGEANNLIDKWLEGKQKRMKEIAKK